MTDESYASPPEDFVAAGINPSWTAGPGPRLRQGDLALAYYAQLRASNDRDGPGPGDAATARVPFLEDWEDRPIELSGTQLVARVWRGWVMVLEQSCELDHKHETDSRVLVAPVAFRDKWRGSFWRTIISGQTPGFIPLPAIAHEKSQQLTNGAWPPAVDAAVCLESTAAVSLTIVPGAYLGITGQMRAVVQQRLVTFWSVRDWKSYKQRDELVGASIEAVDETGEQFIGPGRLHKVHLTTKHGADEITVGIVFAK